MKPLSIFWVLTFALAGCMPVSPTMQPMQIPSAIVPTISTSVITTTGTVSLSSDTPSPTITLTPLDTLEPAQVAETLQPLLKAPMNCDVPCFWGIIPGKTSFDEARIFFSQLGLTPFEGTFEGKNFYTILYNSGTDYDSSVTLHINNNLVENMMVTPDISKPKEGSPREWIAYSPETLIKRYGSPSRVQFAIGSQQSVSVNMIMYFDTSNLIVHYSGYDMTPESFCPLTASFDFVRLWIGLNPLDTPSFETVSLENATSLTMDQFAQLMIDDSKKACFAVK